MQIDKRRWRDGSACCQN